MTNTPKLIDEHCAVLLSGFLLMSKLFLFLFCFLAEGGGAVLFFVCLLFCY